MSPKVCLKPVSLFQRSRRLPTPPSSRPDAESSQDYMYRKSAMNRPGMSGVSGLTGAVHYVAILRQPLLRRTLETHRPGTSQRAGCWSETSQISSISRQRSVPLGPGPFGRLRRSPWRRWLSFHPLARRIRRSRHPGSWGTPAAERTKRESGDGVRRFIAGRGAWIGVPLSHHHHTACDLTNRSHVSDTRWSHHSGKRHYARLPLPIAVSPRYSRRYRSAPSQWWWRCHG